MYLTPFAGIPFDDADDTGYADLMARAAAVCTTEALLRAEGVHVDDFIKPEDRDTAETVVLAYAKDPVKTSKVAKLDQLSTPSVLLTSTILKEFGQQLVASANEIRVLVTNKLIIESDHPDAKIRLRSLELLGKMTDVGLFTERKHITLTQKSPDEVAEQLRTRLTKLRTLVQVDEGVYVPETSPLEQPLDAKESLAEILG